jgi:hypothetical protein
MLEKNRCMDDNAITPSGKAAYIRRQETEQRTQDLKNMGYYVMEIWECEIDEQLNKDEQMAAFFNDLNTKGKIIPRDGLYGGITMAFKMLEKSSEEHEIAVFDVKSLYPYINYTGPYPLGHPKVIHPKEVKVHWDKKNVQPNWGKKGKESLDDQIIWEDEGTTKLICGVVKVRVLPPRKLYFPILPLRIPGSMTKKKNKQLQKLLFPLCCRCATEYNTPDKTTKCLKNNMVFDEIKCPHTDQQRKFTVQTTTVELCEALKRGYTVDRFYRAWHYSLWTDDNDNPFRYCFYLFLTRDIYL